MKRFSLLFFMFSFISLNLFAQKQIVVQNGTNATLYDVTQLQAAINEAAAGSDIYLPGGHLFNVDIVVNKKLNIYGAGAFDSTSKATGITKVSSIHFEEGDGSSLEGVNCNLYVGVTLGKKISDVSIKKSKLNSLFVASSFYSGDGDTTTNINFKDCVIMFNYFNNISIKNLSTTFYNCVFERSGNDAILYTSHNANFNNCVFHIRDFYHNIFADNSSTKNNFENCIFRTTGDGTLTNLGRLNIFKNCIVTANQTDWGSENMADSCLINQHIDSIFVKIATTDNSYSEANDYHLKSTCAGKNYGTDGTDLGIYGSAIPFKEGSVPIIPYINAFAPAKKTANGQLEISVDVKSQTK